MASPYPSIDLVLQSQCLRGLIEEHGRALVADAARSVISSLRKNKSSADANSINVAVAQLVQDKTTPRLRPVFNLTGIVLHTNLGRALLSEQAIAQSVIAMAENTNLEFGLITGSRGERDSLVEDLLTELTGTEAAIVVNNNAAAVLLVLAALAEGREVVISRGELVEIGGSFRIPDVMRSAQVKLVEVGTTNRTHAKDYKAAIGTETAALMKVHTSNYVVTGFVATVVEQELAAIAKAHKLPMIADLGSGSLIDLSAWGLPKEPVVREVVGAGCDVVTFSGDKLLGGPQSGLIVGRKKWIDRIRTHPLKRALRASKQTYAALEATLLSYRSPEQAIQSLPTLRHLTRPLDEIKSMADRLQPLLASAVGEKWTVTCDPVKSQVGSGSLPIETIPSQALAIRRSHGRGGKELHHLAERFRALAIPIIGRISQDALLFDLRCLDDEAGFAEQLQVMNS